MTASQGLVVCLALTGLIACSSGTADRAAKPQEDQIETCADVVTDPVFHGDADVLAEFDAPGQPKRCTLQFDAGSPALAAIGAADACPGYPLVAVSIDDGAWAVDSAQTDDLTAANC